MVSEPTPTRRGRKEVPVQPALPRTKFEDDEAYSQYLKKHQNRVNVQLCREKKRHKDRVMEDKVLAMEATLALMNSTLERALLQLQSRTSSST